jgi:hypothetical protein
MLAAVARSCRLRGFHSRLLRVTSRAVPSRLFHVACAALCLFSAGMTVMFFAYRWSVSAGQSPHYVEKIVVAIILGLAILGWIWGIAKRSARPIVLSLHLALAGIVATFCLLELIGAYAPSVLPRALLQYRPELATGSGGLPDFLDHLPDNPWVKPKPNIQVTSVGYGGGDFTPSWITDSLGFKNPPELASVTHVTAVAVGDSFVEGMGAPTPDVWTALLTARGLTVYNLGVQGYAPQQLVGTLRLYGERFHPSFVIIGYTPSFEGRTLVYANGKPQSGNTGGVGSMEQYIDERRKYAARFRVTNAFFSVLSDSFKIAKTKSRRLWSDARGVPVLQRYAVEVDAGADKRFDAESREWSLTTQALLELKDRSVSIGATPIVLLFSHRPAVYYEALRREPIPDTHYEMGLRKALNAFCVAHEIAVVDTFGPLSAYVRSLPATATSAALPYWELDAHMSLVGNRIVADTLERYLRSRPTSAGR